LLFHAGSSQALTEAIDRMLSQRERWPQMRSNGRRFVEEERTWERSVANYRPVFESIAGVTA